jgi:hypothetical protein
LGCGGAQNLRHLIERDRLRGWVKERHGETLLGEREENKT